MDENKKISADNRLKISEDVLRTVVLQAVHEIRGVHGLEKPRASFMNFFLKEKNIRPVRIDMNSDAIKLDIGLKIKSGFKLKDVAEQIQKNVKSTVQNMTGIMIVKVNIHIVGIV